MYWILAIILNIPVYGVQSVTPLNKFDDIQVCWSERDRVRTGMQEAYPGDTSYRIECLCQGEQCHVRESTNTITPSMDIS